MFEYLMVLNPIIGLAINCFAQVSTKRFIPSISILMSKLLGFVIGLFFTLTFQVAILFEHSDSDQAPLLLVNVLIYGLLGQCYSEFVGLGQTSIRVRALREILDSRHGLTMEDILEKYNAKQIVDMRLSRLLSDGQIDFRNGRYYSKLSVVLGIAKAMAFAKLIVYGNKAVTRESAISENVT